MLIFVKNSVMDLKDYRSKHNLTQQELSDATGLSLRTIQRIESGLEPKGHTKKVLEEIIGTPKVNESSSKVLFWISLSTLISSPFPVLNFIVPFAVALIHKKIDASSEQIIKSQVLFSLLMIGIGLTGMFIDENGLLRDLFLLILILIILVNLTWNLIRCISLYQTLNT